MRHRVLLLILLSGCNQILGLQGGWKLEQDGSFSADGGKEPDALLDASTPDGTRSADAGPVDARSVDAFVADAAPDGFACPTISLSPTMLAAAWTSRDYLQTIVSTGGVGPYTVAVTKGSLPPSLSLDGATGIVSGVPSAGGAFSFTLTATDMQGCAGTLDTSVAVTETRWAQWKMPDSSTFCSDGTMSVACPSPGGTLYGQDGNYKINDSTRVVATDTVLDTLPNLMWQRNLIANSYTWADAKTYCESLTLDGYLDWRLPSRIELISIVNFGLTPPVDTNAFPSTPTADLWTASIFANGSNNIAFAINFTDGSTDTKATSTMLRARCVRTGG